MTDPSDDSAAENKWEGEFWKAAMSEPAGRHVIADLLDKCGSRQRRFNGDGDTHAAAFRDGAASIGDHIESMLEQHCPDRWMQMIRERRAWLGRAKKNLADEEARRQQNETARTRNIIERDAESMATPPHPLPGGVTAIDVMADAQMAAEAAWAKAKEQQQAKD